MLSRRMRSMNGARLRSLLRGTALAALSSALSFSPVSAAQVTAVRHQTERQNGTVVPVTPILDPVVVATKNAAVVVTGRAPGASQVEVATKSSSFFVPVTNDLFSANVVLRPNQLNKLFFTTVLGTGMRSAPAVVDVIQDTAPPSLHVDFPANGTMIYTPFSPAAPKVDVAGRVGDFLSGFQQLSVSINGQPAIVDIGIGTNGTFLLQNLQLNSDGPTLITASARDGLGNAIARQITLNHTTIPPDAPQMLPIGGSGQSDTVLTELPQPVVVRVFRRNPSGSGVMPFPNKLVTFTIARSDGLLSATQGGVGDVELAVATDANGDARAWWTLGGDAGCGNNRIDVASAGILGTVAFCASANGAPASQINVGAGGGQIAEVSSVVPERLRAWVSDSCNPVSGVPVRFKVVAGNGKVNGQNEIVVFSSTTGHAEVALRLGPQPIQHVIEASFDGNPGQPATFLATAILRDEPTTKIAGVVLNNSELPIEGAVVTLTIGGNTLPSVLSGANGGFQIDAIPGGGAASLDVDGLTATRVGGVDGIDVPLGTFPHLAYEVLIVPNGLNTLPKPVLLPPLNPINNRFYSTSQPTVLSVVEIVGLQMVIVPGSMTINGLPAPDGTVVSLNRVNHDDIPMPMEDGAAPPFAWTLQPAGAHFHPPVRIAYPNMSGLAPGSLTNFLSFDHNTERFEIVATGRVSDDGFEILTDPESGLSVAGWGCNCPPYSVTEDCCGDDDECEACPGDPPPDPCCDGTPYDPATHGCCDDNLYDLATEDCCDVSSGGETVYSTEDDCCDSNGSETRINRKHPIGDGLISDGFCQGRVQDPAWMFEFDGCSLPIPNNPIFDKDNPTGCADTQFGNVGNGPCDNHDICYQTCNSASNARLSCDQGMLSDMTAVCLATSNPFFCLTDCLSWAGVYYVGLRAFGFVAFNDRQDNVCLCCP